MRLLCAALLATALPLSATAGPDMDTITPANTLTAPPTQWLGETPHLIIMGKVNGHVFDVQYPDLANADLHAIDVKREYLIDGDARPYQELDFGMQAVIEGVAKTIEFKLNHADFLTLSLPVELALQAEENPEGDKAYLEYEFEWEHEGVSTNEEVGDWTGTATLIHDDAFGASAPVGDGLAGGYVKAQSGENHLVISYTFEVSEADVDE